MDFFFLKRSLLTATVTLSHCIANHDVELFSLEWFYPSIEELRTLIEVVIIYFQIAQKTKIQAFEKTLLFCDNYKKAKQNNFWISKGKKKLMHFFFQILSFSHTVNIE